MFHVRLVAASLVCMSMLAGCLDRSKITPSPETARRELALKGISYDEKNFRRARQNG
jgi:hypothetical protein